MRNTLLLMGLLLSCLFTVNSYAQKSNQNTTTVTINAGNHSFYYTEPVTLTNNITTTITTNMTVYTYLDFIDLTVTEVKSSLSYEVNENISVINKTSYKYATLYVALKVSEETTVIVYTKNGMIVNLDDIELIYPDGLSLQYPPENHFSFSFRDNDLIRSILPIINITDYDGSFYVGFPHSILEFYAHLFNDVGGGHSGRELAWDGGYYLYAPLHPSNYAWYKPNQGQKFYVLDDGFYYWNGTEWRGY